MKKIYSLLAGFSLSVCAVTAAPLQTVQEREKDYVGYLFTYFTGNHISEEAVCYAVSLDGSSFWALNDGKPTLRLSVPPAACATRISFVRKMEKPSIWCLRIWYRATDGIPIVPW